MYKITIENLNISIMSWRKTNDFEILNENWNKVSAVTSIQRDIDLLAEEIHRVHHDILIEGAPGAFMTGVWNKGKELKNRASNVVRGLGKLSRGEATPGGIDVKSQFNLDQLQSVWKNFHNDVFKMIPKNKMVRQFPEINQAIDDLANMIARADSESGSSGSSGSDTGVASSGEGPTRTGRPGSTVGRLETGGEVSDEPVNTADVTQRAPIPGQDQEISTPGSQNEQPVQEPQDITKQRPGESDSNYRDRMFDLDRMNTLPRSSGERGLAHLPGETGEQYVQRMLSLGPDHPTFKSWMKGDGAVPPSNDQVRQTSIDKHLDDALKDDMPTDQDLNKDAAKLRAIEDLKSGLATPDQDSVKQNVEDFYAKLLKKDPEDREEPKEEPKPEVEEEPKPEVEEEPESEVEEEPPAPSTARYMNPGDDYEATISDDKPEYASGDKEFEVGVSDDPGDDNFTMGVADDDSESDVDPETDDELEPDDEPSQSYTSGYMGGFRPGSATTPGAGSDDAQSAEERIQDNLDKGEPVSAADIQAMRDSGMNRDTKVTYTSPKTGEEKTVTLHSLARRRTNRESYQHKYNTIGSVGFMSDKWGQL